MVSTYFEHQMARQAGVRDQNDTASFSSARLNVAAGAAWIVGSLTEMPAASSNLDAVAYEAGVCTSESGAATAAAKRALRRDNGCTVRALQASRSSPSIGDRRGCGGALRCSGHGTKIQVRENRGPLTTQERGERNFGLSRTYEFTQVYLVREEAAS